MTTSANPSVDADLREIVQSIADAADDLGKEPCDVGIDEWRGYQARMGMRIPRATVQRYGGYARVRASHYPPKATPEARLRRRAQVIAIRNNRVGSITIDAANVLGDVEDWARRTFTRTSDVTKPLLISRKAKASCRAPEISRWIIVDIGDLHCGANLLSQHTGCSDYGPQEEARRMAKIVEEVCEYKTEYRKETGLIAAWGGDLTEGEIHKTMAELLWKQIARATHLGFSAVEHFSRTFREVLNVCVSGNHDDFASLHGCPDHSWNGHAMGIYQSMRMHMASKPNVKWNIPQSAFATFSAFGRNFYVVHGHEVITPGNPGGKLDVARAIQQIDRLNASDAKIGGYASVFCHHVHTPVSLPLDNGTHFIINGPFTPINTYAKSIGYHRSSCCQFLAEMTPDYAIGDQRWITLDEHVDQDARLDKVVPTWHE